MQRISHNAPQCATVHIIYWPILLKVTKRLPAVLRAPSHHAVLPQDARLGHPRARAVMGGVGRAEQRLRHAPLREPVAVVDKEPTAARVPRKQMPRRVDALVAPRCLGAPSVPRRRIHLYTETTAVSYRKNPHITDACVPESRPTGC